MTQAANVNKNPANNPERNVHLNETYEEYCDRRFAMKKTEKALKRGVQFYDYYSYGPYRNDEKRRLQAERKARRNNKRNAV